MKRFLSLLLLCAMCILSLFACSEPDDGHGKPTVLGEESNDLISALIDYLESQHVDHDMAPTSFAIKIRKIKKDGAQPLLVEFDSSTAYYVCGYYKGEHPHSEEKYQACCASDYLWLRYERAEDIREEYRGRTCIAAFELYPALSVTDIRSDHTGTVSFERFTMLKPVFEEGYNTTKGKEFNRPYIYLNSTGKSNVYTTGEFDYWNTFSCVEIDGQLFIPVSIYVIEPTGERYDYDLKWEFGEYYDRLTEIMITDKYTLETTGGSFYYKGVFSIDDFGEILK
mgnify:CR=1 FL=1